MCVFFISWGGFFSRGPIHASFSEPCFECSRMSWNNPQTKNKLQRIPCDRKTISTIHCSSAIYFSNSVPGTFLKRQNLLSKSCASSRPKKKKKHIQRTHACRPLPLAALARIRHAAAFVVGIGAYTLARFFCIFC